MNKENAPSRLAYPTLPEPLVRADLDRLFTPSAEEVEWASQVTATTRTKCGLLTLLKIFQTLGRFEPPNDIPSPIVRHVAATAGLPEMQELSYVRPTLYRHHALIREFVNVSAWNRNAVRLVEDTVERLAQTRAHPTDLFNGAVDALFREHFELPAQSTLRRIVGNVQQRVHDHLFDEIQQRLSAQDMAALEDLLNVPSGTSESTFATLCRSPGRTTRKNLARLIERYRWLQLLPDPKPVLAGLSPSRIEQWSDEGRCLTATEMSRYRTARRHALLLSVLFVSRGRLLDDLVIMLTKTLRNLYHRADRQLQAWQHEQREASEHLIGVLSDIVSAFHSAEQPVAFHESTRAIVDEAGGAAHIIERCETRLRYRSGGWPAFTVQGFRSQRGTLMDLAAVLPLEAMPGARNRLAALNLVLGCRSERDHWIRTVSDLSFLPRNWGSLVRHPSEPQRYHRRHLEIALFFELADALKSGDIFVPGSCSYGAYSEHLFPIETEPQTVAKYLAERGLPGDGQKFVTMLRDWLYRSFVGLEKLTEMDCVKLDREGKAIVPRPASAGQPDSATELEQKVIERLPPRTILEALYNTDRWTGWTQHFGPPTRMGPQLDNASQRYILTSFAHGCGLGPTQASRHFKESVPAHLLIFANRRHMGLDALRAASSSLIDFYTTFELPSCWGMGDAAAADGTLVGTYNNNLLAAHHVRYGRRGGIAYRHVADNYIALFSQFIPCGAHEAVYILDGLIENVTTVRPSRVHADTHGQSTAVFALAYLLGIELMPRIRNWRALTLYSPVADNDHRWRTRRLYGATIDWDLIGAHWEDYLRVVLAIQTGRVSASWILTRLNSYSRRNRVYLAFQELGRVIRTIYLLDWIAIDELRHSVTDCANKVETFHEFSGHLRFGSDGVLRSNDLDQQAKGVVYNELVANAVMLQTVVDQTRILNELHSEGRSVDPDDAAYLSPYVTRNLKRFGEYDTHYNAEPKPAHNLLI